MVYIHATSKKSAEPPYGSGKENVKVSVTTWVVGWNGSSTSAQESHEASWCIDVQGPLAGCLGDRNGSSRLGGR